MKDYSDYPKSLSEIRADRTLETADWTPRDVLISILRQIDKGELAPTRLAVVYSVFNCDEDSTFTKYMAAGNMSYHECVGLFTHATKLAMG